MNQIVYVASPKSQQIHVWCMDNQGQLTLLQLIDTPGEGQSMAIHPNNTYLYIGIRPIYGVVSYYIDNNGLLNYAGTANLPGAPTQITTDLQGKHLYSVSYRNNCLSFSSINEQGIVGAPKQILNGLNKCHSANVDATNKFLWVPCMQENRIRCYKICKSGYLVPLTNKTLDVINGSGPRHMVFHRTRNYAYVINEFSGTVNVIIINDVNIDTRIIQTLKIVPSGLSNTYWASDIHITPDNLWLYCCDRASNIISWFSVSKENGMLDFMGYCMTENIPRGFNIDNQGKFLVVAGQQSNHIVVYAINKQSGKLISLKRYAVGLQPMWISILTK